jgi:hypothetical protein
MYRAKVVDTTDAHVFVRSALYLSLDEFRDNDIKGNTNSMSALGPT